VQWTHAQSVLTELHVDYKASDRSILNIIEDLEDKYDLNFAYSSESFDQIKVNVNYQDRSLSQVLNELTAENRLEYKIFDDVIMLRKSSDYNELVSSQNYKTSYHLKGKVIESSEDIPMAYASIFVENSNVGTYTDENGSFDIEVPAKYAASKLIIQYLGYDDQQYKIEESEDNFLLVPLNVSAYSISEIMIVNRDVDIHIGGDDQALVINETQIQNTTSGLAGNDLSKNLQLLPGISASDDASADIKIRGSNSDETLLILDGIPVYNASHYYGIFSSINSNYVESINLYKNAFPIQYGGKTAGVVEMLSQNKLDKEVNFSADISGRSTIGNVSNTNFNAFTSRPSDEIVRTQNFQEAPTTTQADPNFNFYDINAKYMWIPNEKTSLSLNYYSSNDDFSLSSQLVRKGRQDELIELVVNNGEQWNNLGTSY